MNKIRVLTDADVRKLLDIKNAVKLVEEAFRMKTDNKAKLFPIVSEEIKNEESEMDIKSGVLSESQVFGVKVVSWFGTNKAHNLPTTTGLAMLFDLENGMPRALLNAGYLTSMRTGAAGAIGVKYLARKNAQSLLMMGTGNQAVFQIAATLSEVESINKVYIYNPLRHESAVNFEKSIKHKLSTILRDISMPDNREWIEQIGKVEFIAVSKIEEVLNQIDIVITATPSHKAFVLDRHIGPGVHLSCMGADISGKQEIEESIFSRAVVYTDDLDQSIHVGEAQKAFEEGHISRNDIQEIGKLILDGKSGRMHEEDVTIFDGTGIALQDIAVGKYLLDLAKARNIGNEIVI